MNKIAYLLFFIGLLFFTIVLVDLYWWINISSDTEKSLEQVKIEYQQQLPYYFPKGHGIAVLNIVLLTIAGFLFFKASVANSLKIISKFFLILCAVIGFWQLFSLM